MNFIRHTDTKAAIGLGILGKRGLRIDSPWIKRGERGWHVKHCVEALTRYYKNTEYNDDIQDVSIFQFPSLAGKDRVLDEIYPKYVITALPGEPIDYPNKINYRKIEYSEIFSKFLGLLQQDFGFEMWLYDKHNDFWKFLTPKENR